jgi:hypothetical protein
VYTGAHMECLQLQLTLARNGIAGEVETFPRIAGNDARVCVDRADLERAAPIVDAFKSGG